MMPEDDRSRRALMALVVGCAVALITAGGIARAEDKAPPISGEARDAVLTMGKTLAAGGFSFHVRTIREYADANGQPLHIFHAADVVARRPDRLSVNEYGDDGATGIAYDGKTLTLYSQETNKYASVPAPTTIEEMLRMAAERMGMEFPLADLLADAPDKAFLSGITSGDVVNTVPVDGVPCRHLFFTQPVGIELELWSEKNDRALPHRLIVTYRALPGQPRFVAEMSEWKIGVQPPDSGFVFRVPDGATRIEIAGEAPK